METASIGSRKWPPSAWKSLLELSLPVLDGLPEGLAWTLGGGTALALSLGHRISYDIDLFFTDSRALKLLSPNRNPAVRNLSPKWQEPGNYIKIERDEGEIDFLVARPFLDIPSFDCQFGGRVIPVEKPAEIIAKKIHYRGSRITVRDIFDIAVVAAQLPNVLPAVADMVPEAFRRSLDRTKLMAQRYRDSIWQDVNPTDQGRPYMERGIDHAIAALEETAAGLE